MASLQEALKSHKPYRRCGEKEWRIPYYEFHGKISFPIEDVMSEFEIYEEGPSGYQLYAGNGNPKQWTKVEKPRVWLWEIQYLEGHWSLDSRFLSEEMAQKAFMHIGCKYHKSRLCPEGWPSDD